MKGITPVIAVILVLLITISLIGLVYVSLNDLQESTIKDTESGGKTQVQNLLEKFRIVNAGKGKVYIRNEGPEKITRLDFFIDNSPVVAVPSSGCADGIDPQTVCEYALAAEEGQHLLVTGASKSDEFSFVSTTTTTLPPVACKSTDPIQFVGWSGNTIPPIPNLNSVRPFSINKPAGTVQGDVMIAHIYSPYFAIDAAPSGWFLINRIGTNDDNASLVFYRVVGASEPASYTWNIRTKSNDGQEVMGAIASYRNVNNLNPIHASAGATGTSGTSTVTAPSLTTNGNAMFLAVFGVFHPSGNGFSWTHPAGMTERYDYAPIIEYNNVNIALAEQPLTAAGPTGPRTATVFPSQPPLNIVAHSIALTSCVPPTNSIKFTYKGYAESWKVPDYVTKIDIDVKGGQGAAGKNVDSASGGSGGLGGRVTAGIPVTSGETLIITVGGQGSGRTGGFGGGGTGCNSEFDNVFGSFNSGGGGGHSMIQRGETVLALAGGGGGGGYASERSWCNIPSDRLADGGSGGSGGGLSGENGRGSQGSCENDNDDGSKKTRGGSGGYGGTQTNGGSGGSAGYGDVCVGNFGTQFQGGNCSGCGGGGGGAGYFGGGAGGGGHAAGGGGGGSAYCSSVCINPLYTSGFQTSNGEIIITYYL